MKEVFRPQCLRGGQPVVRPIRMVARFFRRQGVADGIENLLAGKQLGQGTTHTEANETNCLSLCSLCSKGGEFG